ncbi:MULTISPECIES: hypothetical protein [unclassified Streptomyces]|uniref:hypothetical protein n=1 Tax=unclassified Streptomyces TaxID=2593676 RepID=UPI002E2DA82E|nr:hypothetical protein [Streptomyces sp. NBC_01429]
MYGYELHKIREAELIRAADNQRLVRQVRRARGQARRTARRAADKAPEGQVSPLLHRPRHTT